MHSKPHPPSLTCVCLCMYSSVTLSLALHCTVHSKSSLPASDYLQGAPWTGRWSSSLRFCVFWSIIWCLLQGEHCTAKCYYNFEYTYVCVVKLSQDMWKKTADMNWDNLKNVCTHSLEFMMRACFPVALLECRMFNQHVVICAWQFFWWLHMNFCRHSTFSQLMKWKPMIDLRNTKR